MLRTNLSHAQIIPTEGSVTVIDPAEVSFSASSYEGAENTDLSVTIIRGGNLGYTFNLSWTLTGVPAAPAADTLTFAIDETSKTFQIALSEVTLDWVGLIYISGYSVIEPFPAPVSITPDSAVVTNRNVETGDIDADFLARATASTNVLYATNFDDVYLLGVVDATRSGINNTTELTAEAHSTPGADQYAWSSTQKLSGTGSLNMWSLGSDSGGTNASWVFKTNGDRTGLIGSGTEYHRHYTQFSVYMDRAALAWRSKGNSSPKVWKAYNDGFEDGETLVLNRRECGFVTAQCNNPTEQIEDSVSDTGSDPFLGTMYVFQNAVTTVSPTMFDGLTADQAVEFAGPMMDSGSGEKLFGDSGGDYDYDAAEPYLDTRASIVANNGFPNALASVKGVPWVKAGWTTVTMFCDFDNEHLMIWAAPYGDAPKLIIDDTGTLKVPSSGDYGHVHQIGYQKTSQESETGVRPTRYRWYDEVITSTDPIKFPNPGGAGYILPGHLGGLNPTELEIFAATISSGGNDNYDFLTGVRLGGEQSIYDEKDLAWQSEFHYYRTGRVFDVFGKRANSDPSWKHIRFDETSETWTDETNNGADSTGPIDTSGHIYGNSAMNPDNGDLFLVAGNSKQVHHYNRSADSWSRITGPGWPTGSHADGVAYHPNLYGTGDGALIVSTATTIRAWRESTDTWETLLSSLASSGEGIGIYVADGDYVLIRGNDGESLYRVNSDKSVDNLGSPPIRCSGGSYSSSTHGSIYPHPDGTSKIILIEHDTSGGSSNRYWTSSNQGTSWGSSSTHSLHAGGSSNIYGGAYCSIPEYGIMWCVSMNDARIWKP